MKVTEDNLDPVHALRHTLYHEARHDFLYAFNPGDYLQAALKRYSNPGATRSRFLFYATRHVILDTAHFPREEINAEYEFANHAFMRRHFEQFQLGKESDGEDKKRVALRLLGNGALKIGLLPRDPETFNNALVGFHSLTGEAIPDGVKEQFKHYAYTIIPASAVNRGAIYEATVELTNELTRADHASYFSISPSEIKRGITRLPNILPEAPPPN